MKIHVKIRKSQGETLVSMCDANVIGKDLEEGKIHLNVKKDFYEGEEIETQEIEGYLNRASIANLVGKNCIEKAIELGYINESNLISVEDIPHAQFVLYKD